MELPRCPDLNEENETEQNGNLVRSSEVGPKQAVRQRHDHKGRDELSQIEGCGEQRHRQDGSRHSFCNVCFFHKNLWSCKLYQAIESFLKIRCKAAIKREKSKACFESSERKQTRGFQAAKVQIKVKTKAVSILKNRKNDAL